MDDLKPYLGRPRFTPESAERTAVPGVSTGLAVTGLGGDVLFIEANATTGWGERSDGEYHGVRSLKITGQLATR